MMASVGSHLANPTDTDWYVDSGASSHMSPFRDLFLNFKNIRNIPIRVGNNEVVHATSMGNISIPLVANGQTMDVVLNNVLYMPDLSNNLFSTSSCMQHNINVIFSDNRVVLQHKDG